MEVKINDVRVEGFPEPGVKVVFYFDGSWVSGWPVDSLETDDDGLLLWEADSDVGRDGVFYGVRYWIELADPEETK